MPRQRWKLTRAAIGLPQLDEFGDMPLFGEDAEPRSLLAEMARDPVNGMEQIAPGVYCCQKAPGQFGPGSTA